MSNRGLTIIELVATIVILGIIAAIAIFTISDVVNSSREKAFIANIEVFKDAAILSYANERAIWDEDQVSLQTLMDHGYLDELSLDPWNADYDLLNSVIIVETSLTERTVFKVKIISEMATLGAKTALEIFTRDDIVYVNQPGSLIDRVLESFDNDLSDPVVFGDEHDEINVEGDLKGDGIISSSGGDDLIQIGDDIRNGAEVNLGTGNDTLEVTDVITGGATINADFGNDSLIIGNDISSSATINLGPGDDTLDVGDDVRNGVTINSGEGDDTITVTDVFYQSTINADTGDDFVTINKLIQGTLNLGDGSDTLTVTAHVNDTTITMGNGDDSVSIGDDLENNSTLYLGEGNDSVLITDDLDNASIYAGSGNDTIILETLKRSSNIYGDLGDDTIEIEYIANSFAGSLNLGQGDDSITIENTRYRATEGMIDGGDGYDVLYLPNLTLSEWEANASSYFLNFERIVLSDTEITG